MTNSRIIDLTHAISEPGLRPWTKLRAGVESSFGGALALVEVPRFEDNDINKGCSSVIAERSFSARSVVVTPDGKRHTPDGYQETDCAFATTGRMVSARTFSAEAVGITESGDYQRTHNPFTAPQRTRLLVEPQLYTGEILGKLLPSQFNGDTEAVAISPDGTGMAFVERLVSSGGQSCSLWEEDLEGRRRLLAVQQEEEQWTLPYVDYSPCGAWLLINIRPIRIVDRFSAASVNLPMELEHAAWDPSAPGLLIATTRENGQVRLVRFDLRSASPTDAWEIRIESHVPYLSSLSLSEDGRWLAGIAPLGLTHDYVAQHGTGGRAFVIDLYEDSAELVLPVFFECGVERVIERVRWVQVAQTETSFQLPTDLYPSIWPPTDSARSGPEASEFLANEAKGGYQLVVEALDNGTPLGRYYEEFLRFCEALCHNDPSLRSAIGQIKDYAFGQFVQGGMTERLWLLLSTRLQELLEGEVLVVTRPDVSPPSRGDTTALPSRTPAAQPKGKRSWFRRG